MHRRLQKIYFVCFSYVMKQWCAYVTACKKREQEVNDNLDFFAFLSVYSEGYVMLGVHAMGRREWERENTSI